MPGSRSRRCCDEVARLHAAAERAAGRACAAAANAREKFAAFEALARSDETPIRPERIVADAAAAAARRMPIDRRRPRHALPVFFGLLRAAPAPAATSSPTGRTARSAMRCRRRSARSSAGRAPRCVAVMGDGSFGFACGELETIVRLGLPITMVVISNATYGWIKAGPEDRLRRALLLGRLHAATDHAADRRGVSASSAGGSRTRPSSSRRSPQALEAGGPTLVDVVDPAAARGPRAGLGVGRMSTYVGQPLARLEDPPFLTGSARYTADLDLRARRMRWCCARPTPMPRSPGSTSAAAAAVPGVLAVYTSADLRAAGIKPIPSLTRTPPFQLMNADGSLMADGSQYPLADGRVRYVGEPVALVVAESVAAARDAAELVEVDWRPLPAVITAEAALAEGAPLLWPEEGSQPLVHLAGGRPGGRRRAACTRPPTWSSSRSTTRARSWPSWSRAPRSRATTRRAGATRCASARQSAHQLRGMLARVLDLAEERDPGDHPRGRRRLRRAQRRSIPSSCSRCSRPRRWAARSNGWASAARASSPTSRRAASACARRSRSMRTAASRRSASPRAGAMAAICSGRSVMVIVSWMAPMVCGPYRIPAAPLRARGRVHQHHADRGLPRHRARRAHLSARAPGRCRGAPDRDRPDRAAPPQPDRAGRDALALADRRGLSAARTSCAISRSASKPIDWAGFPKRRGSITRARAPARHRRLGLRRERRRRAVGVRATCGSTAAARS